MRLLLLTVVPPSGLLFLVRVVRRMPIVGSKTVRCHTEALRGTGVTVPR